MNKETIKLKKKKGSRIIGILLILLLILGLYFIVILQKSEAVTDRLALCVASGKTYIYITMLEGLPAKIDFCGDIEEIKSLRRVIS